MLSTRTQTPPSCIKRRNECSTVMMEFKICSKMVYLIINRKPNIRTLMKYTMRMLRTPMHKLSVVKMRFAWRAGPERMHRLL